MGRRANTHTIGATAKYTLYLASRCELFTALSVTRWLDATNEEIIDSIVPVATGPAAVAAVTPPDVRPYHLTGPSSRAGSGACVELLVHTDDASAVWASPSPRPQPCASGC